MANEIRLRSNNISGTTTDNPLTAGATTINSPGFVDLPVVNTTNHLILILDPLEVAGQAEIVQVTSHAASSSSVTVVRGFDTTTPRQHNLGTTWFHGPVVSDYNFTDIAALSTNRPANPVIGQLIYETDTNSYVGRGSGPVWQTVMPLGAWTSFTPTVNNITVGNGTIDGHYARHGRTIIARAGFTFGTTSVVSGRPGLGVPFPKRTNIGYHGSGYMLDSGNKEYHCGVRFGSDVHVEWLIDAAPNGVYNNTNPPFVMGAADFIEYTITYEAAS